MGTAVLAIPKPDSYVNEWAAVQNDGAEAFAPIRRLVKGSRWQVQIDLSDDGVRYVFTSTAHGLEQWTLEAYEWVVKSPHGKFWFMGVEEFQSQFTVSP